MIGSQVESMAVLPFIKSMLLVLKGHDRTLGCATKRDNVTKCRVTLACRFSALCHVLTTMCASDVAQGHSLASTSHGFAVRSSRFAVRRTAIPADIIFWMRG